MKLFKSLSLSLTTRSHYARDSYYTKRTHATIKRNYCHVYIDTSVVNSMQRISV